MPGGACFIVRDHNGQALSYVYYENEPGRRAVDIAGRQEAAMWHRLHLQNESLRPPSGGGLVHRPRWLVPTSRRGHYYIASDRKRYPLK